jgi:hypothetical protein
MARRPDFIRDMTRWLNEGEVVGRETIVDGIENAPAAFLGMLHGENIGKAVVQLGPE